MIKKVLHISPDFNYSCGVSKLVYLTLSYFNNKENYENHFITNGGDSLERINELNDVKLQVVKFSKGLKNIFYMKNFYKSVMEYCKDSEIDIIHTYHRFPEYIAAKISKEIETKSVGTVLSFVEGYKKISFKSDKLITVSNVITKQLIDEFDVEKKRIATMYLPKEIIDVERYNSLKSEYGIEDNKKVLLFMGRINFIKNVDNLLKAYEIVYKKFQNVMLILCGSTESKKISNMINKLSAPLKVLQPLRNNQTLYTIADMVVLPSRIDPFPFVMIESGSFKKPFIGGNTGGIAEFIDDGVDGLLVEPEKPQVLADKILYLLNNKDRAEQLGNNLYKKVTEKCDYNKYFSTIEEIYDSLLSK